MADWDGLRQSLEAAVQAPPLDALRERRRRRQQRRTAAVASALMLVTIASGATVLGRRGQRDAGRTQAVAGSAIDRVALGDRLPPPRDYADYVVTDVDFVSAADGWAIGLRCRGDACDVATWRTADGGRSWGPEVPVAHGVPRASFAEQDPAGGGARSLRMVDEHEGFAFNPDLYVTHDGARTWQRVAQPSKVAGVQVRGRSAWVFERGCAADDDCDAVLRSGVVGLAFTLHDVRIPRTRGALGVVRRETPELGYLLSWDAPEGPRAALRRTLDGGSTWTDAVNPCPDAGAQSLSAGLGRPLWLVCGRQVQVSADRGATWRRTADLPGTGTVTDLIALSATTAYVTTQQPAALLVTTDGGATWAPAPGSGRSGYGYGNLDVADARHAWAMGDAGLLWRTTDGTTWERLTLPPGAPRASAQPTLRPYVRPSAPDDRGVTFTGLSFTDDRHGWALGQRCTGGVCRAVLRRTTDGGVTWRRANGPPGTWMVDDTFSYGRARFVRFADDRNGWVFGRVLFATHDGGATWHAVDGLGYVDDVVPAGGAVWTVSYEGCASSPCGSQLYRGTVTGDAFVPVASAPRYGHAAFDAADAAHAYLVDDGGFGDADAAKQVSATADGGATWTVSPAPCPSAVSRKFSALAPDALWVLCAGRDGRTAAARSADGGATWRTALTPEESGPPGLLRPVSATDAWWAGYTALWLTRDGGRTWAPAAIAARRVVELRFLTPDTGWALGDDGVVYRTTDGETWERTIRP
jgi:photosystem II stability/assembly factor-like uncharacterized protein